ncbi:MAG: alpha/beta fold hydrolase, partial [Candidatus Omnitrophota bacterium]
RKYEDSYVVLSLYFNGKDFAIRRLQLCYRDELDKVFEGAVMALANLREKDNLSLQDYLTTACTKYELERKVYGNFLYLEDNRKAANNYYSIALPLVDTDINDLRMSLNYFGEYEAGHALTISGLRATPTDFSFAQSFSNEFNWQADDWRKILEWLVTAGKITGPPTEDLDTLEIARNNGTPNNWEFRNNLTEPLVREAIQALADQLHFSEKQIFTHLRTHENETTEELAIQAQVELFRQDREQFTRIVTGIAFMYHSGQKDDMAGLIANILARCRLCQDFARCKLDRNQSTCPTREANKRVADSLITPLCEKLASVQQSREYTPEFFRKVQTKLKEIFNLSGQLKNEIKNVCPSLKKSYRQIRALLNILRRFYQQDLRQEEKTLTDIVGVSLQSLSPVYAEGLTATGLINIRSSLGRISVSCDVLLMSLALGQIFSNMYYLLASEGGTGITRISLTAHRDHGNVQLIIKDNGPGFRKDMLKEVDGRQRAFLLGETSRQVTGGTGLGLAFLWEVFRQHGWRVEINNGSNLARADGSMGGARFVITIPDDAKQVAQAEKVCTSTAKAQTTTGKEIAYQKWLEAHQTDQDRTFTQDELERLGLLEVLERMDFPAKEKVKEVLRRRIVSSVRTQEGAIAQASGVRTSDYQITVNAYYLHLLEVLEAGNLIQELPDLRTKADIITMLRYGTRTQTKREITREHQQGLKQALVVLLALEVLVHEAVEIYFWDIEQNRIVTEILATRIAAEAVVSYAQAANASFNPRYFEMLGKILDKLVSPEEKRFSGLINFYLKEIERFQRGQTDLVAVSYYVGSLAEYRESDYELRRVTGYYSEINTKLRTSTAKGGGLGVARVDESLVRVVPVTIASLYPNLFRAQVALEKIIKLQKEGKLNVTAVVFQGKKGYDPENNLTNEEIVAALIPLSQRDLLPVNRDIALVCREANVNSDRLKGTLLGLLFKANRSFILKIIIRREITKRCPDRLDDEELFDRLETEARLAIEQDYAEYDFRPEVKFITFIGLRIRGRVGSYLNKYERDFLSGVPNYTYDYRNRFLEVLARFKEAHDGRSADKNNPDDVRWIVRRLTQTQSGTIGGASFWTQTTVTRVFDTLGLERLSLDAPEEAAKLFPDKSERQGQARTLLEVIPDPRPERLGPERYHSIEGLRGEVETVLASNRLTLQEEIYLRLFYGLGENLDPFAYSSDIFDKRKGIRTYEEVGRVVGVVRERVSQIIEAAFPKFKTAWQDLRSGTRLTPRQPYLNDKAFGKLGSLSQRRKINYLIYVFGFNYPAVVSLLINIPEVMIRYRVFMAREYMPGVDIRKFWVLCTDSVAVRDFAKVAQRADVENYLESLQKEKAKDALQVELPSRLNTLKDGSRSKHRGYERLQDIHRRQRAVFAERMRTKEALFSMYDLEDTLEESSFLQCALLGCLPRKYKERLFSKPHLCAAYTRARILMYLQRNKPDIYRKYLAVRESLMSGEILLGEYTPELCDVLQWFYSITVRLLRDMKLSFLAAKRNRLAFEGAFYKTLQTAFPELGLSPVCFYNTTKEDWLNVENGCSFVRYRLAIAQPQLYKEYLAIRKRTREDFYFDPKRYESQLVTVLDRFYCINSDMVIYLGISDRSLSKEVMPYFEGSYITMMVMDFPELELNPLVYKRGIACVRKSEAYAVDAIRYWIVKEVPDMYRRYLEIKDKIDREGLVVTDYPQEVRDLVKDFQDSFDSEHMRKLSHELMRTVPIFYDSIVFVLAYCFPELRFNPLAYAVAKKTIDKFLVGPLDMDEKEMGVEFVRFKVACGFPYLWERYLEVARKIRKGELSENEFTPELLEVLGLFYQTFNNRAANVFRTLGLTNVLDRERIPSFGASIPIALSESFSDIGLSPIPFARKGQRVVYYTDSKYGDRYMLFKIASTYPDLYTRYLAILSKFRSQEPHQFLDEITSVTEGFSGITVSDFIQHIGPKECLYPVANEDIAPGASPQLVVLERLLPALPLGKVELRKLLNKPPEQRRGIIASIVSQRYAQGLCVLPLLGLLVPGITLSIIILSLAGLLSWGMVRAISWFRNRRPRAPPQNLRNLLKENCLVKTLAEVTNRSVTAIINTFIDSGITLSNLTSKGEMLLRKALEIVLNKFKINEQLIVSGTRLIITLKGARKSILIERVLGKINLWHARATTITTRDGNKTFSLGWFRDNLAQEKNGLFCQGAYYIGAREDEKDRRLIRSKFTFRFRRQVQLGECVQDDPYNLTPLELLQRGYFAEFLKRFKEKRQELSEEEKGVLRAGGDSREESVIKIWQLHHKRFFKNRVKEYLNTNSRDERIRLAVIIDRYLDNAHLTLFPTSKDLIEIFFTEITACPTRNDNLPTEQELSSGKNFVLAPLSLEQFIALVDLMRRVCLNIFIFTHPQTQVTRILIYQNPDNQAQRLRAINAGNLEKIVSFDGQSFTPHNIFHANTDVNRKKNEFVLWCRGRGLIFPELQFFVSNKRFWFRVRAEVIGKLQEMGFIASRRDRRYRYFGGSSAACVLPLLGLVAPGIVLVLGLLLTGIVLLGIVVTLIKLAMPIGELIRLEGNSLGPGTGKNIGVILGNLRRAFLRAFFSMKISPLLIIILWWGYFFTNFSRFFWTNVSLSKTFLSVVIPFFLIKYVIENLANQGKFGLSSLENTCCFSVSANRGNLCFALLIFTSPLSDFGIVGMILVLVGIVMGVILLVKLLANLLRRIWRADICYKVKNALSAMYRQVNIKFSQLFDGQTLTYIEDFYAKYFARFVNVAKNTFSYFYCFFNFRFGLKLDVKSIRIFIIRNLHKLSLLCPITGDNYNVFSKFFINHFQYFFRNFFRCLNSIFKSFLGFIRAIYGRIYYFFANFSLKHSYFSVFRKNHHGLNNNISFVECQLANLQTSRTSSLMTSQASHPATYPARHYDSVFLDNSVDKRLSQDASTDLLERYQSLAPAAASRLEVEENIIFSAKEQELGVLVGKFDFAVKSFISDKKDISMAEKVQQLATTHLPQVVKRLNELDLQIQIPDFVRVEFWPTTPNNRLAEVIEDAQERIIILSWAIITRVPPEEIIEITLLEEILHYTTNFCPEMVHELVDTYIASRQDLYRKVRFSIRKMRQASKITPESRWYHRLYQHKKQNRQRVSKGPQCKHQKSRGKKISLTLEVIKRRFMENLHKVKKPGSSSQWVKAGYVYEVFVATRRYGAGSWRNFITKHMGWEQVKRGRSASPVTKEPKKPADRRLLGYFIVVAKCAKDLIDTKTLSIKTITRDLTSMEDRRLFDLATRRANPVAREVLWQAARRRVETLVDKKIRRYRTLRPYRDVLIEAGLYGVDRCAGSGVNGAWRRFNLRVVRGSFLDYADYFSQMAVDRAVKRCRDGSLMHKRPQGANVLFSFNGLFALGMLGVSSIVNSFAAILLVIIGGLLIIFIAWALVSNWRERRERTKVMKDLENVCFIQAVAQASGKNVKEIAGYFVDVRRKYVDGKLYLNFYRTLDNARSHELPLEEIFIKKTNLQHWHAVYGERDGYTNLILAMGELRTIVCDDWIGFEEPQRTVGHGMFAQCQYDAHKNFPFANPFKKEFIWIGEDLKAIVEEYNRTVSLDMYKLDPLCFQIARRTSTCWNWGKVLGGDKYFDADLIRLQARKILADGRRLRYDVEYLIKHIETHEAGATEEEGIRLQVALFEREAKLRERKNVDLNSVLASVKDIFQTQGAATKVFDYTTKIFPVYARLVYLLITNRCPLKCGICFMGDVMDANPYADMDIALIKNIADQLHGFDEVYLSGGEPFCYMQEESSMEPAEAFWEVLEYLSKRVKKVTINTNGFFFLDQTTALVISQRLARLGNVKLVVSVDIWHDSALRSVYAGKGDKEIVASIREVKRSIPSLAIYFSRRYAGFSNQQDFGYMDVNMGGSFYKAIGLDTKNKEEVQINLPAVAMGRVRGRSSSDLRKIDPIQDILLSQIPERNYLFVDASGRLLINVFATGMLDPPEFCIAGDLTREPLSLVLFNSLFRRFIDMKRFGYLYLIFLSQFLRMLEYRQRARDLWNKANWLFKKRYTPEVPGVYYQYYLHDFDDSDFLWVFRAGYDLMTRFFIRILYYQIVFIANCSRDSYSSNDLIGDLGQMREEVVYNRGGLTYHNRYSRVQLVPGNEPDTRKVKGNGLPGLIPFKHDEFSGGTAGTMLLSIDGCFVDVRRHVLLNIGVYFDCGPYPAQGTTHNISPDCQYNASTIFSLAAHYQDQFNFMGDDFKAVNEELFRTQAIRAPPGETFNPVTLPLAYHRNGQMHWAREIIGDTELEKEKTVRTAIRDVQPQLNFDQDSIITHIKIHEAQPTEEKAIKAQVSEFQRASVSIPRLGRFHAFVATKNLSLVTYPHVPQPGWIKDFKSYKFLFIFVLLGLAIYVLLNILGVDGDVSYSVAGLAAAFERDDSEPRQKPIRLCYPGAGADWNMVARAIDLADEQGVTVDEVILISPPYQKGSDRDAKGIFGQADIPELEDGVEVMVLEFPGYFDVLARDPRFEGSLERKRVLDEQGLVTFLIWVIFIGAVFLSILLETDSANFGDGLHYSFAMAGVVGVPGVLAAGFLEEDKNSTLRTVLKKGIAHIRRGELSGSLTLQDRVIFTGIKHARTSAVPTECYKWEAFRKENWYLLISVGRKIFEAADWFWRSSAAGDLSLGAIKDAVCDMILGNEADVFRQHLVMQLKREVDLEREVDWIWIDRFQEGNEAGIFRVEVYLRNNERVVFGIVSAKNPNLGSRVVKNDCRNLKWIRALYTGFNQIHSERTLPYEVPEVYRFGYGNCVVGGRRTRIFMFLVEWLDDVYEAHPMLRANGEQIFLGLERGLAETNWPIQIAQAIRERSIILAATIFELAKGKVLRIQYSSGDIVVNVNIEGEITSIYLITIPYFCNDKDKGISLLSGGEGVLEATHNWVTRYGLEDVSLEDRYLLFLLAMLNIESLIFGLGEEGLTTETFAGRVFPESEIVFSGLTKALIRMYGEEAGVSRAKDILERFIARQTEFHSPAVAYLGSLERRYRKANYEAQERALREKLRGFREGSNEIVKLERLLRLYGLSERKIIEILEQMGFRRVRGDRTGWQRVSSEVEKVATCDFGRKKDLTANEIWQNAQRNWDRQEKKQTVTPRNIASLDIPEPIKQLIQRNFTKGIKEIRILPEYFCALEIQDTNTMYLFAPLLVNSRAPSGFVNIARIVLCHASCHRRFTFTEEVFCVLESVMVILGLDKPARQEIANVFRSLTLSDNIISQDLINLANQVEEANSPEAINQTLGLVFDFVSQNFREWNNYISYHDWLEKELNPHLEKMLKVYCQRARETELHPYFNPHFTQSVFCAIDEPFRFNYSLASETQDRIFLSINLIRPDICEETRIFVVRLACDFSRAPAYKRIIDAAKYLLYLPKETRMRILSDLEKLTNPHKHFVLVVEVLRDVVIDYEQAHPKFPKKIRLHRSAKKRIASVTFVTHKELISFDGSVIHYAFYGRSDSRHTLVLVHGLGMNAKSWRPVITFLEHGYRALARGLSFRILIIDLPGHGTSLPVPKELTSMEDYTKHVKSVLQTEEIKNAILVGHSEGGMVCLNIPELYQERQDLIAGFVAIATCAENPVGNGNFVHPQVGVVLDKLAIPVLSRTLRIYGSIWDQPSLKFFMRSGPVKTAMRKLANQVFFSHPLDEDAFNAIYDSIIDLPLVTALRDFALLRTHNVTSRLTDIKVPVLWIIPERDVVVFAEQQRRDAQKVVSVGGECLVVEDAKHNIFQTHPRLLARVIVAFVRKRIQSRVVHDFTAKDCFEAARRYPDVKDAFERLGSTILEKVILASQRGAITLRGPPAVSDGVELPEEFPVAERQTNGQVIWNIPIEQFDLPIRWQIAKHESYPDHDLAIKAQAQSFENHHTAELYPPTGHIFER